MKTKFVIMGMRGIHPIVGLYGVNIDALPAYLCDATENHRSGIFLTTVHRWVAFTLLIWNAKRFDSRSDAEKEIQCVIDNDNGWLRPLTILEIYE